MANDCYKCKYRKEVPGSAHSSCSALNTELSLALLCALGLGDRIPSATNPDGVDVITFDPVGVFNGWCLFPANFDPVWVTCNLNIEDVSNITS